MDLSIYPISFFLSALALIAASLFAWKHRRHGWGLPMLAVLGTVGAWYHGDALYNDYEVYRLSIGDNAINAAWWQVLLFLITFVFLVPPIHRAFNKRFLKKQSNLMIYTETSKIKHPSVQSQIDQLGKALLVAWIVLMVIALYRMGFNFGSIFTPYLEGWKAKPWSRGRVGGGLSALLSLASYVQIMLTASFGVVAAISVNPRTRTMAIIVCFLAFPYYIFDRTRNPMIATMLPGLLAWVFISLKGGVWKKAVVLLVAFLMANFRFAVVVDTNMGRGVTVGDALKEHKQQQEQAADEVEMYGGGDGEQHKHQGLNMFSELCHMNDLLHQGLYSPTWGGRYFAEAANFIPRGLWKNKPLVGVDYALARGFADDNATSSTSGGGITASIATGMIGQGVANFGRLFGPMAAALLMAIWVAILARLDLHGDTARLLLCVIGLILTFNMGRDITLFVLYPFFFGYMLLLGWEWWRNKNTAMPTAKRRRRSAVPRQGRV